MTTDGPLLEARRIGRRVPGTRDWLLDDVSLCVRAGECVALVGASGAGKTLLLRALAMIDRIDVGEVLWRGAPVAGNGVPGYRGHVMYVAQRPALVAGTIADNLHRPFRLGLHRTKQFRRDEAVRLLDALGRDAKFLEKHQQNLSGGESQIMALVRALQLDPQVLLLDEPTASLDGTTCRRAEHRLTKWLEDQPARHALLWVTHDMDQARRVASRIVHMDQGRLRAGAAMGGHGSSEPTSSTVEDDG